MLEIRCPQCNRLLMKADFVVAETVCGKCKELVKLNIVSQKADIFRTNKIEDSVESEKIITKLTLKKDD